MYTYNSSSKMKYKIDVRTDSFKTLTYQKSSHCFNNKISRDITFNEILCQDYFTINYKAILQEAKLLS